MSAKLDAGGNKEAVRGRWKRRGTKEITEKQSVCVWWEDADDNKENGRKKESVEMQKERERECV